MKIRRITRQFSMASRVKSYFRMLWDTLTYFPPKEITFNTFEIDKDDWKGDQGWHKQDPADWWKN